MCGIFGSVGDPDLSEGIIGHALESMAHRGPDGRGIELWPHDRVGFGHCRLAIIDLSETGRNPMSNEDGNLWITFNGEIYNFVALRQELEKLGHRFRSTSDTEVILHAYEEWGDEHVHRLRGMFAYGLFDRRVTGRCRILLVRDRMGIKPLHYYFRDARLLFSSEIKGLLAYPGVDSCIDRSAIFDYLTYGYVPPPKTAYSHIRKLPAGHTLVYNGDRIAVKQYWAVPIGANGSIRSLKDASEEIRETLAEAVRLHMVSDVPIGSFLSGGIDSSTVTSLMAQSSAEPVRTFSVGFDVKRHTETEYARLMAQHLKTLHCERTVGFDSAQEILPRLLQMYDEPFAGSSAVPTHLISVAARRHVKVVLSGDGGDEVFAGYRRYSTWLRNRASAAMFHRLGWPARLTSLWPFGWLGKHFLTTLTSGPLEHFALLVGLLSPREKRELLRPEWRREFADYDDLWFFRQHWRPELGPLTRLQVVDMNTYLPAHVLTKVDRASMAVSLEVRPPLLDHVLVERALAIGSRIWELSWKPKHLLKESVKDLLPSEILKRPKKGFSAPVNRWMRNEREWAQERLSRPCDMFRNLEKTPWLLGASQQAWSILILRQWLDHNEASGA